MDWTIDFYKTEDNESPVEEWLLSIPETALAKITRNMGLSTYPKLNSKSLETMALASLIQD